MATLDVTKIGGGSAGQIELAPEVFEASVKPHLFHAEVTRQLSRRRAGTHATKNRSAVSGGGAKPYRQKGTGRARQGTTRAPQYAGGGSVFGPVPRSYEHRLNKKLRQAALRSALSLRQQEGGLRVVEGFELDEWKTKLVVQALAALDLSGRSALIVVPEKHPMLERAARNLPGVDVIAAVGLNVHDVLAHEALVIVKDSLDAIHARLAKGAQS